MPAPLVRAAGPGPYCANVTFPDRRPARRARWLAAAILAATVGCALGPDEPAADAGADDADDGTPPGADVPDNAYCDEVHDWDASWRAAEEQVLAIVNQRRAEGADCGVEGSFASTHALAMDPALRCAARKHSADMAEREFFAHDNPSGEEPWDRIEAAGYAFQAAGENIAAGQIDAAMVMQGWMDSDGHCANIMNPDFTEIGVGFFPGGQFGTLWTQDFAAPL